MGFRNGCIFSLHLFKQILNLKKNPLQELELAVILQDLELQLCI